jgi:hypothetical protein
MSKQQTANVYVDGHPKVDPAEAMGLRDKVFHTSFSTLQGKILTLIDSLIPEGQQNKATKDLATQMIWDAYSGMVQGLHQSGLA